MAQSYEQRQSTLAEDAVSAARPAHAPQSAAAAQSYEQRQSTLAEDAVSAARRAHAQERLRRARGQPCSLPPACSHAYSTREKQQTRSASAARWRVGNTASWGWEEREGVVSPGKADDRRRNSALLGATPPRVNAATLRPC